MIQFFGPILNFLGGGIVGQIGKELNQAHQASLNAKNNSERINSDNLIAGLTAKRDVLKAEARDSINRLARVGLALPFGLYLWKIIVYDKMMGMGATDNLPDELWYLMGVVFSFYFVSDITDKFWKK